MPSHSPAIAVATKPVPAEPADVDAIAGVFARAFRDYRQALGCDAATLARLWRPSIAARLATWTVVRVQQPGDQSPEVAGVIATLHHGGRRQPHGAGLQSFRVWLDELGVRGLVRALYAMLPLALAYLRRPPRADELYISLLAVDPRYEGRGIGRLLLADAARQAHAANCAALSLHVAATNERARRLYTRAGFVPEVHFRPPYQGPMQIPAFIAMRRPLA